MTDLEQAKMRLAEGGFSCVVVRNGKETVSLERGVKPLLDWLQQDNRFFAEASVADKVIGKAAAMLFVKANVKAVFAKTLSLAGRDYLDQHGIPVTFETLTERIMNREQTDVCPMERAVADTDDVDEGCRILQITLNEVRRKSKP